MKRFSILFTILALSLASCAPEAEPTPDPAKMIQAVNARVTELAAQTLTAYVSPTPTMTPLPSATPTKAVTPSPTTVKVDFTGNVIYTAFMGDGTTQVSIIVPNGIKGDYTATIDGKEFVCFSYIMKTVPRLICNGPEIKHGYYMTITVYPKGSQKSIFEREFVTPY